MQISWLLKYRKENEKIELKSGQQVVVDYFSATFPLYSNSIEYELKLIEDIKKEICDFLRLSHDDIVEENYARNRFKYEYKLGDYITLRFLGPKLKSGYPACQIELKGEGCREFERLCPDKNWSEFIEYFTFNLRATPTRFDLAVDDYEGTDVTFEQVKERLENKMFTSPFKSKVATIHGSKENGYTLNLGKYGLSRMLCIYEKHKQQQQQKKVTAYQPYWIRFEMRYFQEAAKDICLMLLNLTDEELKTMAFSLLYKMLDIKKGKPRTDMTNLYREPTEDWWLKFLDNASKAKIIKDSKPPTYNEEYFSYVEKNVTNYFIAWYVITQKDEYELTTKVLELIVKGLARIDDKKMRKINTIIKEYYLPKMSVKEFDSLKDEVDEILKKRELPF